MFIKNLQRKRIRGRAGFTLVELMIVLAIIAVLAAVLIPATAGIVQRAQHSNRSSIARTIYMSVQDHLAKSQTNMVLKSTFSGHFFEQAGGKYTDHIRAAMTNHNNVRALLDANGGTFPAEETALGNVFDPSIPSSSDNIRFVSKPAGYIPVECPLVTAGGNCGGQSCADPGCMHEVNIFYNLLDEAILDKGILNNAILMEYNIRTGVVLSIFYGDAFEHDTLTYIGFTHATAVAIPADCTPFGCFAGGICRNVNNVTGERGFHHADGDYGDTAELRKQGYYGVRETGAPPPPSAVSEDIVNIFDGARKPLEVVVGADVRELTNVLYAELFLAKPGVPAGPCNLDPGYSSLTCPQHGALPEYTLELFSAETDDAPPIVSEDFNPNTAETDFYAALLAGERLYLDITHPDDSRFHRFIWIIDYFGMGVTQNVGGVDASVNYGITIPEDIRVKAVNTDSGASSDSLTKANTLFSRELTANNYEITSARHLNNVRHKLSASFRQTQDIYMGAQRGGGADNTGNVINNFTPLGDLEGSYSGLTVSIDVNSQHRIDGLRIGAPLTPAGQNVGLFTEISATGSVDGLLLSGTGTNDITARGGGVLAGRNFGTISRVSVEGFDITMENDATPGIYIYAGGIVGVNEDSGRIRDCVVRNVTIEVPLPNPSVNPPDLNTVRIGALAGENRARCQISSCDAAQSCEVSIFCRYGIQRSGAEECFVISGVPDANVGGLVGRNEGSVSDVYFLSTELTDNVPVSSNGGGIIGYNAGFVSRAMYIAPAPRACDICGEHDYDCVAAALGCETAARSLYPIVRASAADSEVTNCFYLSGLSYRNKRSASLIDSPYNHDSGVIAGAGISTSLFDKSALEEHHNTSLFNWNRPQSNYPYPVSRNIPGDPVDWPIAQIGDSVDVIVPPPGFFGEPEDPTDDGDNGGGTPGGIPGGFTNGNFNDVLLDPNTGQNFGLTGSGAGNWNNNNPGFMESSDSWGAYYHQDWVQGWESRPVNRAHFTTSGSWANGHNRAWMAFEFQRAHATANSGRARATICGHTSADGRSGPVYAELNAHLETTIYQICQTRGFGTLEYSFHHLTRDAGTRQDQMNFYLTGIPALADFPFNDPLDDRYHAGYDLGALTFIRPCWSPRSQPANNRTGVNANNLPSNSRYYNPNAANSVAYGNRGSELRAYWDNARPHWNSAQPPWNSTNRSPASPFAGANWSQPIYVYDVWVGSPGVNPSNWSNANQTQLNAGNRSGYGITFWSTRNLSVGTGSNNAIPTAGITEAQLAGNTWTWLADARNNQFGSWDVVYGWKQYSGTYYVPFGQDWTEFAFQAAGGTNATHGNYLAGVHFGAPAIPGPPPAPAFLSIEKTFVAYAGTPNERRGATTATPNTPLTVELNVTNSGETTANSIVIEDRFGPFRPLLRCGTHTSDSDTCNFSTSCGFNIRINGAAPPAGTSIQLPTTANDHTLRITLPGGTTLSPGASLLVTFQLHIRERRSDTNALTNGIELQNQGRVSHSEGSNVSPIARLTIGSLLLDRTVRLLEDPNAPLVDGPFRVTLSITNNSSQTTVGRIHDIIPNGYTISNVRHVSGAINSRTNQPMPPNSSIPFDTYFTGTGSTNRRLNLEILDVQVPNNGVPAIFTYTLIRTDNARDGSTLSISPAGADARYIYRMGQNNANATFPRQNISMSLEQPSTHWTQPPSLTFDASSSNRILPLSYNLSPGGGYAITSVTPVLTNAAGSPITTTFQGMQRIQGTDPNTGTAYEIRLLVDQLTILPNAGPFSVTLYYRINAVATRAGFPALPFESEVQTITINYTP
jgi:prepilin-type N-terminal cleavage/methylation domain-containing protein